MWKQIKAWLLSGLYKSSSCYTFLKSKAVRCLPPTCKTRLATSLPGLLVRNLRQKQRMLKCLFHEQFPYISRGDLLPKIIHCCWCFPASCISYEAYVASTKTICLMEHCAVILCFWFHKFLVIQCDPQGFHNVNFKFVFTSTELYVTFNATYFLASILLPNYDTITEHRNTYNTTSA
jgi:hypothetical protein